LLKMRDFELDQVSTSVLLSVQYAPNITCEGVLGGTKSVKVNSTNHEIVCEVKANPPADTPDKFKWSVSACGQVENSPAAPSDIYTYSERDVSTDRKTRKVVLGFKQPITKEYFLKLYCLRVSNDVGSNSYPIRLQEAGKNTGSTIASSFVLLVATALSLTAFI